MKRLFSLITVLIATSILAAPAAAQADRVSIPRVYNPNVCAGAAENNTLSDACLAMIEAFPRPTLIDIEQDRYTLSEYSFWKVGPDALPLFDGPGGNVVSEIPAGFNFVRAIDLSVDGWLQIEDGHWVQRERATYVEPSIFNGVQLTTDLEYPFAWILDLSRVFVSEYPGGPASTATGRWLHRYERVNIFATAYDDEGWRWYMIGPNQWVKQTFVAKVQPTERPEGVSGRWVAVDLYEQTLVAYEDDRPVYATLIASGLPDFSTNEGIFEVWARLPRDRMAGATGAPDAYALQSVPWVMYFDGGISLHGTYWHDYFGYRRSHGCVNLSISDARWLFNWFLDGHDYRDESVVNYVYVYSSGEYGVTATGL